MTGLITIRHAVQQTPRPHIFPAIAMDGGGAFAVVNITMTVQCATPAPPLELQPVVQFLQPFYEFPVQCGTPNTEVGQVSVRWQ